MLKGLQRMFLIIGIVALIAVLYLLSLSYHAEDNTKNYSEQAAHDSLQFPVKQTTIQQESEQPIVRQCTNPIEAKKKEIDEIVRQYGIEQMLDTVSSRSNITIPCLRIADE